MDGNFGSEASIAHSASVSSVERLAVVELGGRSNAVGAIAEEDLVEIQLEDLVLGQRVLDAERQQHLGKLARVAVLGTQEEIARDLLGDRAAALGRACRRS